MQRQGGLPGGKPDIVPVILVKENYQDEKNDTKGTYTGWFGKETYTNYLIQSNHTEKRTMGEQSKTTLISVPFKGTEETALISTLVMGIDG